MSIFEHCPYNINAELRTINVGNRTFHVFDKVNLSASAAFYRTNRNMKNFSNSLRVQEISANETLINLHEKKKNINSGVLYLHEKYYDMCPSFSFKSETTYHVLTALL